MHTLHAVAKHALIPLPALTPSHILHAAAVHALTPLHAADMHAATPMCCNLKALCVVLNASVL